MVEFKEIKVVAEIPSGKNGSIKVRIVDINADGKRVVVDIRKWTDTDKYTGPTKSGLMLDWDAVNKFVEDDLMMTALAELDKAAHPEKQYKKKKTKKKSKRNPSKK